MLFQFLQAESKLQTVLFNKIIRMVIKIATINLLIKTGKVIENS